MPSPLEAEWGSCNLACAFSLARKIQEYGCCLTSVWKKAVLVKNGGTSDSRLDDIFALCNLDDPCEGPAESEAPSFGQTPEPEEDTDEGFVPEPAVVDPPPLAKCEDNLREDGETACLEGGNKELKTIFEILPQIGSIAGVGFIVIATGCLFVNYCKFRKKQQQIAAAEAEAEK